MNQIYSFFLLVFCAIQFFGCNKNIYNTATIVQLPKDEYLQKLKASTDHYLLDIRTKLEYNRGHLDGARSLSLVGAGFDEKIELLNPERPVFIYCETAHRSPFATMKLKRVGFTRIYDLKGGYSTLREKED